jgi:hypothetical protein
MSLPEAIREQVRSRAICACEFCGVTEADTGGLLTMDHFRPSTQGGSDALDNLLYCCPRCNQYKADYWPADPAQPPLWNPRQTPASAHFIELDDGQLHSLSAVGAFTLRRLRLNRPPLVALRRRKRLQADEARLLARYRDLAEVLEHLNRQQAALLEEQHQLLEEQRALLRRLLADD